MKSKLQTGIRVAEMSVNKTWVHSYVLPEHFIFDRVMCNSEMCHPRCVFKLYGGVDSVKNTTIIYG